MAEDDIEAFLRRYEIDIKDVSRRFNEMNTLVHDIHNMVLALQGDVKALSMKIDAVDKSLSTRIDDMGKRIDDWRDSTKTYFVVLGVIVAIAGILIPILLKVIP